MSLSMSVTSAHSFFTQMQKLQDEITMKLGEQMVDLGAPDGNKRFKRRLVEIVQKILVAGQAFIDFEVCRPSDYGFETLEEVRQALLKVQTLWVGQIDLEWENEIAYFVCHKPQPGERPETLIFAQFVQGDKFDATIYDEHLFMVPIMEAARNGKKPLNTLSLLADEGFRRMDQKSPTWGSAVGPS